MDGLGPRAGDVGDVVAQALRERGEQVVRAHAAHFLRGRSLRLEFGTPEPEDLLTAWFDDAGMVRELLAPLLPGGRRRCVTALRDPGTDRSMRVPAVDVGPRAVLVLDGPLLGRDALAGSLDLVVHLSLSEPALLRAVDDVDALVFPGARPGDLSGHVLAEAYRRCRPVDVAQGAGTAGLDASARPLLLIVAFDHPARPALLGVHAG